MDKCWVSHWYLRIEANLVLMKDQVCYYQVYTLRLLCLVTLRVQCLDRVILWVIQNEIGLEVK